MRENIKVEVCPYAELISNILHLTSMFFLFFEECMIRDIYLGDTYPTILQLSMGSVIQINL